MNVCVCMDDKYYYEYVVYVYMHASYSLILLKYSTQHSLTLNQHPFFPHDRMMIFLVSNT